MFPHVLNQWGYNEGIQSIQLSHINSSVLVVQHTHNIWGYETFVQRWWKQAKKLTEWLKLPFERRQGAIHNFLCVSSALNMGTYPQNASNVLDILYPAGMMATVHDLVTASWWLTIREVHEEPGISFSSSQAILTEDMSMRPVSEVCLLAQAHTLWNPRYLYDIALKMALAQRYSAGWW